MPTISAPGYVGMVTVNFVTITELIGGYFAIARVTDVSPPPIHAVNRGIAVNGLCGAVCSVFGNVCGNVPYLIILGCVAVTKIASRAVFLTAGVLMILAGVVGKIGAVFTLIPDPVVGGVNLVSFAMLCSVGLSLLEFVDLKSPRNLLIIGMCLVLGLIVPAWMEENQNYIKTGSEEFDQVLAVLLSTPMFITGFFGCMMDNIIPGTKEERGLKKWRASTTSSAAHYTTGEDLYQFPYISQFIAKLKCCAYCPASPTYNSNLGCFACRKMVSASQETTDNVHSDL